MTFQVVWISIVVSCLWTIFTNFRNRLGVSNYWGRLSGRVGISSLLLFYPFEMPHGK